MPKINWKSIGKLAYGVGKQLFPVIGLVEILHGNKSSQEKQDAAFSALHDELLKGLLPEVASDPRIERDIRTLINDAVKLQNTITEVLSEEADHQ